MLRRHLCCYSHIAINTTRCAGGRGVVSFPGPLPGNEARHILLMLCLDPISGVSPHERVGFGDKTRIQVPGNTSTPSQQNTALEPIKVIICDLSMLPVNNSNL